MTLCEGNREKYRGARGESDRGNRRDVRWRR